MGANAKGKAHILLLCVIIMVANDEGKAHILLLLILIMGANAEGKAHILLLLILIMGANAKGTHIAIVLDYYYSPASAPFFGSLLLPQRRPDRNKKYIAVCASVGLGVLVFFYLITRKEFWQIGNKGANSHGEFAWRTP